MKYKLTGLEYSDSKNMYMVRWHEQKPGDRWRIKSVWGSSDKKEPQEILSDVLRENNEHHAIPELSRLAEDIKKIYKYVTWKGV